MRASLVDKADPAFAVSEGDKIFAEQPDTLRLSIFREVLRRQEWYPVEPEQLSEGGTLADPHQLFIVFVREHERPPIRLSSSAATRADNPNSLAILSGSATANGLRGTGGASPASTMSTMISIRRRSRFSSTSSRTKPSAVQPASSG